MGNHDDNDNDEEESGDDDNYDDEVAKNQMLHGFIRTFHNGDHNAKFDDKLNLDRDGIGIWSGAARATQESYNKPDNWVERNRIGIEKVKEQLKKCIRSVKYGEKIELKVRHNIIGHQLLDNEEPIVWHEPNLDEYWNKLVKSISKKGCISSIIIENVEMKKERLAALVTLVRSDQDQAPKVVILENANLCKEGIVSLSKLVDVSSQLDVLRICYNRIDNIESARCLSRSLRSHDFIDELNLIHCDLGRSPEILSVILQSDVCHIDLKCNNIDSMGAVKIAEYLGGDPPIEELTLNRNQINDDDAILISRALKRNTHLKALHIYSNNLTSIGVKALLTCVFDSSSLNAISESNHTLGRISMFLYAFDMGDFIFSDQGSDNSSSYSLCSCIDGLLHLDRKQKILLALQDKISLLNYLADAPVKLMPEVLAFRLQRAVDKCQRKHLNVVYSIMRWWNMPLLYSYKTQHRKARSVNEILRGNKKLKTDVTL
jgi:hypothetical protein